MVPMKAVEVELRGAPGPQDLEGPSEMVMIFTHGKSSKRDMVMKPWNTPADVPGEKWWFLPIQNIAELVIYRI